jgi:hypothetical protein
MIERESLRSMIRDVIEAELSRAREGGGPTAHPRAQAEAHVRIASDDDLSAFAKDVLLLAENRETRQRILSGAYPFRLTNDQLSSSGRSDESGHIRLDQGVVTEATLAKLPKGLKALQLGPGVVVTPLARERARTLGIQLERRRT